MRTLPTGSVSDRGLQLAPSNGGEARGALQEETGLLLPISQCVWIRRHIYTWEGRRHDQYERYFVARSKELTLAPLKADSYVIGHRWWSLSELEQSNEDFAPRRLAHVLPPILIGEYPNPAIDCGV